MNTFIILFILIANIVACLLIFYSFGRDMERNKKIKLTLIIIGAMYIITSIIYFLSGIGIDTKGIQNMDTYKNYLMMSLVPVNLMLIMPYSIYSFMKTQKKELKKEQLNKRLLIIEIVAIIIVIIEFFYFRNAQKNMKLLVEKSREKSDNQEIISNIYDENTINGEEIINAANKGYEIINEENNNSSFSENKTHNIE